MHLPNLRPIALSLDEQLPVISGHIICILLKSRPATKNTPVILISGHEELESIATLCEAEGFLKKPFSDIHHLTELVKKVTTKGMTKPA